MISRRAGEITNWVVSRFRRPLKLIERWTPSHLAATKFYLESLPAGQFALDDWMLLVDYLVHRYLSPDDTRTEAEWLASRSAIMGRVQAAMGAVEATPGPTVGPAAAPAPERVDSWRRQHVLSAEENAVLAFGREHCCESIPDLTDSDRCRMRDLIMDWQEATYLGNRAKTAESLQSQLFDNFGILNRDMREIAITEETNIRGNGLIASLPFGTRVRRFERHSGCSFCRSVDGKVLTVVDPAAERKDFDREVWVGKTSVPPSSRYYRGGTDLYRIKRGAKAMKYVAAGANHSECHGGWTVLSESSCPVDPVFSAWMDEVLGSSP